MKTLLNFALIALLLSGCIATSHTTAPPPPPPPPPAPAPAPFYAHPHGYQYFYDELAPYGDWVNYPGMGYVWIPMENYNGFVPYSTAGYWAYTEYGYTWISDYVWGWAPFHYGRWNFDPYYGWFWVPGNTWAPAWVTWGYYNGYYGWAPMPPNYAFGTYMPPNNYWVFVDPHHMHGHDWHNYQVNSNNTTIINNNITIINNYYGDQGDEGRYHRGPRKEEVEKTAGITIPISKIDDMNKPGKEEARDGSVKMYRPEIDKKAQSAAKPKQLKPIDQVKKAPVTPAPGNTPSPVTQPKQDQNNVQQKDQVAPSGKQPTNRPPYPPKPPTNPQNVKQPVQNQPVKQSEKVEPATAKPKTESPKQAATQTQSKDPKKQATPTKKAPAPKAKPVEKKDAEPAKEVENSKTETPTK